jgi:hypothetical protein
MANLHNMLKHPIYSFSVSLPVLLALGWSTGTWGSTLSDPTRPPSVWLAAQGITLPGHRDRDISSGVQLILIGTSNKFAIINGRIVKPGKFYNGSKVLDINSDGVVTRDASKSLKLIPAVSKKIVTPAPPKKPRAKTRKSKKSANENGGNQ